MKKCEHKKWKKWQRLCSIEGVVIVERTCKKCGWVEIKSTRFTKPEIFQNYVKKVVLETLKEQAPKNKKKKK